MLCIEYDVDDAGLVELVALINVVDEDGADPQGAEWLAWRRGHEDGGWGCAVVAPEDLTVLEATTDPVVLHNEVERIILADRATKEATA